MDKPQPRLEIQTQLLGVFFYIELFHGLAYDNIMSNVSVFGKTHLPQTRPLGRRAEAQLHPFFSEHWNKLESIRFGSSLSGAHIKEDRTISATKNHHCYGRIDDGLSTHVCQEHQVGFFVPFRGVFDGQKKCASFFLSC